MSSLSPEPTQPELSGLTVILGSGGYIASGINIVQASGTGVVVQSGVILASGIIFGLSADSIVSGAISVQSGAISVVSGSITVNSGTVAVSGLFAGFSGAQKFLSGGMAVSGAIPVVPMMYDYSGAQWTPHSTNISGSTILSVYVASGTVAGVTATTTVSGLFAGSSGGMKFMSGVQAFSGAIPVTPLAYDFSGAQWVANNVHYSGGSHIDVNTAKTTAVMGLSGLYSTAASSVPNLSGGVPLSSGVVVSVLIRNWSGNTPIFVGFSGQFPASGGGAGFCLYGADGLTVEAQNMNLVYVVAQTSGTLISHMGQMY